ncbi:MAG: ATP-dependent protease subunit HslV [Deltaproteobacteria bacterium]|nr:ATP-dependent protease subunit HslV [Deltaproteobacteria bacterium]
MEGTTILAIRDATGLVLGGDGQVTHGDTILKAAAKKIRRLGGGRVLAGFAGSTADSFALFERFEDKLKSTGGNLTRAAVELAKDWRTDRSLRQLQALLIVGDPDALLMLTGGGDVVEPEDGIAAIGSGGAYALAAAKALRAHTELDAEAVVRASLAVAASICIYTNDHFTVERIPPREAQP